MAPSITPLRRTVSLAESIEVTIVSTETSTYVPAPLPAASAASWHHRRSPPPTPTLASFPIIHSPPFSVHREEETITAPPSPPPSYAPSLATPHTTPLSFFPPSHSTSADLPPPSYRNVPRTRAESAFWWGFLCPFVFLYGVLHLWRPERPVNSEDLEAAQRTEQQELELRVAMEEGMYGSEMQTALPSVKESLELWREEELLWVKRCACCFGGFIVLGTVFSVVVVNVTKGL